MGPRGPLKAVPDPTGNNTGNWTILFDPSQVLISWTQYEIYKMVVTINSAAGVVPFQVWNGPHPYSGFQTASNAEWSDYQPMIVDSGETVYFYFQEVSSDNTPPQATIWTQVDLDIAKRT